MGTEEHTTVYISIGNSDDKLTQEEWSMYVGEVNGTLQSWADTVHGNWRSLPDDPWQNACWAIEFEGDWADKAKVDLKELARKYGQDSIAWAVATTEFLEYGEETYEEVSEE